MNWRCLEVQARFQEANGADPQIVTEAFRSGDLDWQFDGAESCAILLREAVAAMAGDFFYTPKAFSFERNWLVEKPVVVLRATFWLVGNRTPQRVLETLIRHKMVEIFSGWWGHEVEDKILSVQIRGYLSEGRVTPEERFVPIYRSTQP